MQKLTELDVTLFGPMTVFHGIFLDIPMFGLGYHEIFYGILSVPHNIVMGLSNVQDSFIGWRVGFSAGVVWAQGGGGFGRK